MAIAAALSMAIATASLHMSEATRGKADGVSRHVAIDATVGIIEEVLDRPLGEKAGGAPPSARRRSRIRVSHRKLLPAGVIIALRWLLDCGVRTTRRRGASGIGGLRPTPTPFLIAPTALGAECGRIPFVSHPEATRGLDEILAARSPKSGTRTHELDEQNW